MWSFRCDLRHVRCIFVLVWPSDQSWCELWHRTLVTQALVWHHQTIVILYMLCELHRITHTFRPDIMWVVYLSWCALRQISRVFVTMWPFGLDLPHTNVTVVRSVVLCDFHSPLVLMWTFGCGLRHIRSVFVLVWPSSDQSFFYLEVTFWIRPSSHKSCLYGCNHRYMNFVVSPSSY